MFVLLLLLFVCLFVGGGFFVFVCFVYFLFLFLFVVVGFVCFFCFLFFVFVFLVGQTVSI